MEEDMIKVVGSLLLLPLWVCCKTLGGGLESSLVSKNSDWELEQDGKKLKIEWTGVARLLCPGSSKAQARVSGDSWLLLYHADFSDEQT